MTDGSLVYDVLQMCRNRGVVDLAMTVRCYDHQSLQRSIPRQNLRQFRALTKEYLEPLGVPGSFKPCMLGTCLHLKREIYYRGEMCEVER